MTTPRHHKLGFFSSYDRGLDILLSLWPRIKEKFPDATLDVAYGWDLFDKAAANNKERQAWKKKVVELLSQPGITEHGRLGKEELNKVRSECGILAYPTYFQEIFMITAVEAQRDGLVPVSMALAALPETIKGGLLVSGSINNESVQEEWLQALFSVMESKKRWQSLSNTGKEFAKQFSWESIAKKWATEFERETEYKTKVSIVTPTIREGFWNIMANNIAAQTYKNLEWIIVDDYKEDRSEIAKKYAQLYGLDIKYVRGSTGKVKRTYSLAQANNIGLANCTGELMVLLQDFVIMPVNGLEELVKEHERHLNDLLAPVDVYYSPKPIVDTTNHEDWFNGEIDVFGEFIRKNVRLSGGGLAQSNNATDWEANYGAIPVHIARKVGGWYEFYDEALGFDNTDIAWRAMALGSKLHIDRTNVAICIDHWGVLGKDEGGNSVNRTRRLNDPRFYWAIQEMRAGRLPKVRTQEIDDKIDLQYTIPEEVTDEDCVEWMKSHMVEIIEKWNNVLT